AMAYPRATEHVPDMIAMVEQILANGCAYESNGSVYFDLSTFPDYGRLSGNSIDALREGHRVEANPEKRSPLDFALWKKAPTSVMRWESPWSVGVPGWHIECTAMATRYLGEQLDIHTGGHDNIFPHHECEIAQFEAATGKRPYVRTWMHNAHLRMADGAKMSKSLGNFYTLRDLVAAGHSPRAIRYLLLTSHYRAPLGFGMEGLEAAARAVSRINDFVRRLDDAPEADGGADVSGLCEAAREAFASALDDDLNISAALAAMFDFMHDVNRIDIRAAAAAAVRETMEWFDQILAILEPRDAGDDEDADDIEALIAERQTAREAKDYARSDAIRDELLARGIVLEDTPQGARWTRQTP
ncbi:cysteine--tRNA ligase, partial [bacterium]|nr:cysteine--tRNA ligase [bacterium]